MIVDLKKDQLTSKFIEMKQNLMKSVL